MYYPELTHTIQGIQHVIDTCCGERNVAMAVNEQVEQLKEYVKLLDPSTVNFTRRDIFNKPKIKAYWDKFSQLADSLNSVIEGFGVQERVLSNTIATLKNKKTSSDIIINTVRREIALDNAADSETLQQMVVADQSIWMLDDLINEYSASLKRVQDIQSVCITAFRQAILVAKRQNSFAEINTVAYESNYRAVKSLLG